MFYIGNNIDKIEYNGKDSTNLPLENLPISYFPFYYNTSETSLEKMRRLVPLLENYIKTDDKNVISSKNTIDTDELFALLSQLEDPAQSFNNNNISHIMYVVIFIWIVITLIVLRLVQFYFGAKYIVVIGICILLLLLIGVGFALFMANSVIT